CARAAGHDPRLHGGPRGRRAVRRMAQWLRGALSRGRGPPRPLPGPGRGLARGRVPRHHRPRAAAPGRLGPGGGEGGGVMLAESMPTRAETVVAAMARGLADGAVVATGAAAPVASLATRAAPSPPAPAPRRLPRVG